MSIEINKKEKLQQLEQVANLSTYPSKCFNSFCYDDDDEDYTIAVTPSLSIEEPDNSLSMGDEHLDTISATESDEFIKFSVENLIPIPSESEGIPENMRDVPFHDNSPPLDVSKDQFEDFFDSNDEFSSIDDDSFSIDNIDYVEASPLNFELVSSEVMEIVIPKVGGIDDDILLTIKDDILREKFLNINLLIANIEALNNPTPFSDFMTKSSSTSLNSLLEETNPFDNSLPEFKTFCFDVEEISSGSTTTRSNISLPEYEAFCDDHVKEISSGSTTTHSHSSLYDSFIFDRSINPFPPADRSDFYEFTDELIHIVSPPEYDCFFIKIEPNSRDFTMDVVEDISPTREPRVHNALPTHPTLQLNLDLNFLVNLFSLIIRSYLKELVLQGLMGSKKLNLEALSLYMGIGQHAAVEAIRSYDLCFPSGLVMVLHNCNYAPSITRGVISVSYLYGDGFINHFDDDNIISYSRNNLVYFSVVPKDGIYEIDLSNSNTNNHSMYDVSNKRAKLNFDSSLLWHCRLRHINKKGIEKLQQDGLLNSTDTKSFEKYVSCLSGKMARKPYSHKVKRAKDLLGLIHTDEHGIIIHRTPSYTPQHNGVSKRRNRTLLDMVRSMMSQTTLPKSFWDYALESATRILNMVPTKKVEKIPYENSLINQEAIGSLEDLDLIQEEDTRPFKITSSHHDEGDQEIDEPQSDIIPISRSTRTRHAPDRMCLNIKDVKSYLGRCFAMKDLGEAAYIFGIKIYRDRSKRLNITSRFQQNPYELHWNAVKNILKYLRNTKYMFLIYEGDIKRALRVSCYTDAGYLTDADKLKSQTRYVFVLNGGAVDWKNTKQSIIVTSSKEAEYIAASDASKEAVWVRKFISGLRVVPTIIELIKMYCKILEPLL
nr:retrovirus-related Pol polyprotein from transposon TNT 1-94 [Tanacetum cinerariifolium]